MAQTAITKRNRPLQSIRFLQIFGVFAVTMDIWEGRTGVDAFSCKPGRFVRPSRADDKEKLEELLWKCYGTILPKDYTADLLDKALPMICGVRDDLLSCGTWYVVEQVIDENSAVSSKESRLVGCGGWTPKSPLGTNVPHLRHFATDPTCLRQGIASMLWDRIYQDVCDHFQQDDAPMMEVYSTLTAEPFYASLGFEFVENMAIPLGDECRFPCTLMRLGASSEIQNRN